MKTHTIKTPTTELLVVELAEGLNQMRKNTLSVLQHDGWELLGKPDEISEEDAEQIVEQSREIPFTVYNAYFGDGYKNYKDDNSWFTNPIKSLLSLLESEIYWENPLGKDEPKCIRYGTSPERIKNLEWREAEQKTFDRNRTLIFKKATPKI